MSDLEKLIESNAKAIAFLSSDIAKMKQDRDHLDLLMANLTQKISTLTKHQVHNYKTITRLDNRQDQLANQQQQLIDIFTKLN